MPSKWPPRIIYNDDTCTLRTAPPPHTVDSINMALDYLKGTQVDCLCWCVGEQIDPAHLRRTGAKRRTPYAGHQAGPGTRHADREGIPLH